jgi:hypothetical protein
LVQLPTDDYYDIFSIREDFLGYASYDDTGTNLLYYADPAYPDSSERLTAPEAFRSYLSTKTNSLGNIALNFSTRREKAGGTFYRGARFDDDGNAYSAGLFLDKIDYMEIQLIGDTNAFAKSKLTGELAYGGTSFIRNFDVGTFDPDRPDRLQDEETAYSTRYWYFHAPTAKWVFTEQLSSPVTMKLKDDDDIPESVYEIDIFKERSVATTDWELTIPTVDLDTKVLSIEDLEDIEIHFYHYACSRQIPDSSSSYSISSDDETCSHSTVSDDDVPFPYYLRYRTNIESK